MNSPRSRLHQAAGLILVLLLANCGNEIVREPISTGIPAAITYGCNQIILEDVNHQWSIQTKPSRSRSFLLVDDDSAVFTPDVPGDYDIMVIVVNNWNIEIDRRLYQFSASGQPLNAEQDVRQLDPLPTPIEENRSSSIQTDRVKEVNKPGESDQGSPAIPEDMIAPAYTVQISSWKTSARATDQVDRLAAAGFEARIERYFDQSNDQIGLRVRLGHYLDYFQALTAADSVRTELGDPAIVIPLSE